MRKMVEKIKKELPPYIETVPDRNSLPCILLRESFGIMVKLKKRTLTNLTHWSKSVVDDLRLLLKKSR